MSNENLDPVSLSESQELNEYLVKYHHPIGDNRPQANSRSLQELELAFLELSLRVQHLEEKFRGKTNCSG